MRVTAAELERLRGTYAAQMAKIPVAAGGGRGRLTTPARTPQVGGPATMPALNRITVTTDTIRDSFAKGMAAARATLPGREGAGVVSGPGRCRKRPATGQDGALRRLQRAAAPRERDLQRDILAFLNAQPGIYAWKAGSGLLPLASGRRVRMGKAGVADIIAFVRVHRVMTIWARCADRQCLRAHTASFIAVEVKRPKGGKPATPLQLAFLARLKDAGSPLAMVATSVDQVRRAVEAL